MVNTGKPSTGCVNCRARHIKCDEGKPACMKCIRTNRVCQGYRNPSAVRFRNLTQQQVKSTGSVRRPWPKATLAGKRANQDLSPSPSYSSSNPTSPPSSSKGSSPPVSASPTFGFDEIPLFESPLLFPDNRSLDGSLGPVALRRPSSASTASFDFPELPESHFLCQLTTPTIPGQIAPSIESQAACFFAANFVVLPNLKFQFGYLDFLLPLLKTSPKGSPLPAAFTAVSLYSFASRPSHREILPTANDTYVKALHQLSLAIRNPKLSRDFATVASILLLALIEVLVPSSTTPRITGWPSHISGAANLMKAWSEDYMKSDVGRSIFRVVRNQMTLDSITNSKEIEFGTEWWITRAPTGDMLQQIANLNLRVSKLRAETQKMMPLDRHNVANIRAVSRLLSQAEDFEPRSAAWFERLLQEDYARVTPSPADSAVFPRNLITFTGFSVAVAYMNACLTRFFILEIVIRCTAWLLPSGDRDYRQTPEYARCATVGAEVVRSVVAALPYFFNAKEIAVGDSMAGNLTFACGLDDPASVKALSGMCCLWPIFSAAGSDFATPEQRAYLVGRLKFAADHLGIQSSRIFLQGLMEFRLPSTYVERDMSYRSPSSSPQAQKATPERMKMPESNVIAPEIQVIAPELLMFS